VDGMPKGLSLTSDAPLTTVMELLIRPQSRETLVHVVNFDRKTPLLPLQVTVRKQHDIPCRFASRNRATG
jgi:hypothetical protein